MSDASHAQSLGSFQQIQRDLQLPPIHAGIGELGLSSAETFLPAIERNQTCSFYFNNDIALKKLFFKSDMVFFYSIFVK